MFGFQIERSKSDTFPTIASLSSTSNSRLGRIADGSRFLTYPGLAVLVIAISEF